MAQFFKRITIFSNRYCQIRRLRLSYNDLAEEKGFTYVEVIVSLTLLVILIPTVLFFANNFMCNCERLLENNKLQLDQMGFISLLFNELHQGKEYITSGDSLEFSLPSKNMIVRYERTKDELRRRIRYFDDNRFQSNSVLMLQHVDAISWRVDNYGVYLRMRMRSKTGHIYEFCDYVATRC